MAEGIPLQTHRLSDLDEEALGSDWHSHVAIHASYTDIVLRIRKNKSTRSIIRRKCTCKQTPIACGKCALDEQVRSERRKGSSLVFPNVRSRDIEYLQSVAKRRDLPRPTWHGFRRGRTTDLVQDQSQGEISLEDIFRSGGWASGSRAILSYLSAETIDRERVVTTIAEMSESEIE